MKTQDSARQELVKELQQRLGDNEPFFKSDMDVFIDFILEDRRRIVEVISQYAEHYQSCLCSQQRQVRPTNDGGYETLYGHGKNEKWYKRGENPPCSCGLDETLKNAGY